jgi:hypothetical protein
LLSHSIRPGKEEEAIIVKDCLPMLAFQKRVLFYFVSLELDEHNTGK